MWAANYCPTKVHLSTLKLTKRQSRELREGALFQIKVCLPACFLETASLSSRLKRPLNEIADLGRATER